MQRATHRLIGLIGALTLVAAAPAALAEAGAPPEATPAAEAAAAEEADGDTDERVIYERGGLAGTGLVVGLHVGGGFSSVFSDLGAAFVPELALGITLPPLERAFEIFFSAQWAAPTAEGATEPDPRLPGDGVMRWDVTQQEVALTLGLRFRIPIDSSLFRPNVALGARAYLLRTEVSGEAGGEPFGDHEETATEPGVFAALGGELFVGPGALSLELQIGYSSLDGYVMRDTNTGSLNLMLGYRLFL